MAHSGNTRAGALPDDETHIYRVGEEKRHHAEISQVECLVQFLLSHPVYSADILCYSFIDSLSIY